MIKPFLLGIGVMFPFLLIAQSADTVTVQAGVVDSTQKDGIIVLLKNDSNLIPLKRLDTLRINVWPEKTTEFDSLLSRYTLVNDTGHQPYNLTVQLASETAPPMPVGQRSILCLLGAPAPSDDQLEGYDAIIYSNLNNPDILDRISQLIFGGIGASDTLSLSYGGFSSGTGLNTPGGLRFSFTTPEKLGYNGAYLRSKIDSIALSAIDSGVAPGIQVLVAKDGHVVMHETYGYVTYDNLDPVRRDHLYDFASVTKITGALPALMQLHDQNKFDLDATMGTYLEYFARGNKKKLQYRKILSHNARLKSWIAYWTTTIKKNGKYKRNTLSHAYSEKYPIKLTDNLYLYKDYKMNIYKQIRKSPLNEKPGYVYSGLSFYLYPEIVERLTGQEFETYLKSNFYRPLGAHTLTYNPLRYYPTDKIIPTEIDTFFRKIPLHGTVHDEGAAMMAGVSSNAGLFGSTLDLAKLIQMYLWKGQYGGQRFISQATMEKFTSCHYCQQGNRRGLAFDKPVLVDKENGSTAIDASDHSFGHSGYTGTFVWADPDTGILFIFMSNRVYPTRANRKLYELNVRPAMHQIIYDVMVHNAGKVSPD
jgi:CubicO group peptidase (beta-lactamase class C family)